MKQSEIITIVRHELEHYKQFSTIARYKGADYLAELSVRSYVESLKRGDISVNIVQKLKNKRFIEQHGEEAFVQECIKTMKEKGQYNAKAYQDIIDKMGVIQEGTPEALEAQQYIEATLKYPDTSMMFVAPSDEYLNNLLEVNARKAGDNPEGFIGDYKKASEKINKLPAVEDTLLEDDVIAIVQGDSVAN